MRWKITFEIETPQTFDRDAVIQVLESERGRGISPIVRAAARWAVEITDGDGIIELSA